MMRKQKNNLPVSLARDGNGVLSFWWLAETRRMYSVGARLRSHDAQVKHRKVPKSKLDAHQTGQVEAPTNNGLLQPAATRQLVPRPGTQSYLPSQ